MSSRHELSPTISLDEAARWLGISYESARRRAVRGELAGAFQLGARWRVGRRALLREIDRLAGLAELRSPPSRRERGSRALGDRAAQIGAQSTLDGSQSLTEPLVKSSGRRPWNIAASAPIDSGPSLVRRKRSSS